MCVVCDCDCACMYVCMYVCDVYVCFTWCVFHNNHDFYTNTVLYDDNIIINSIFIVHSMRTLQYIYITYNAKVTVD